MEILINFILLIVGFALLMKGADWFVDGSSALAIRLGIPQIVIGLTIVALGTSLPEASVSIASALQGAGGISIGNVLGSNIMNILLILGLTSLICAIPVDKMTVRFEIPFLVLITIGLGVAGLGLDLFDIESIFGDNVFSKEEGFGAWALMIVYLVYLRYRAKSDLEMSAALGGGNQDDNDEEFKDAREMKSWLIPVLIIVGMAMITVGSKLTVDSATAIATDLGVDDRIIGLTIVAFGTSLPELVTSIAAARKGNTDIAIGNIVGSNIFNILFVIGTAAVIRPIEYVDAFRFDTIVAVGAAVLLLVCLLPKHRLNKITGVIMLACFAVYYCRVLEVI